MRLLKESIKTICESTITANWEAASDGFPDFLSPVSPEKRQKNEQWLDGMQQEADAAGKNRRKAEALMQKFIREEPILGARALGTETLQSFLEEMKSFQAQCRKFDAAITQEALFQAFRNYSVYAVFLIMNGLPQRCHQAILAYSLLYPYTDNVLDSRKYSLRQKKELNDLIYARLCGQKKPPSSPEQEKAGLLLGMLDETYPYGSHRTLYDSLLLIYDAQLASQRQQDPAATLSAADVLGLSVYKGGNSVLADRCLMPLPLTPSEVPFYLGIGFFLQLCDDLQDIEEDLASGSKTLFTMAADAGERSLLVNRMFHYLETLFTSNRFLFTGNETAVSFFQKNCHTLILSTVLSIPQFFRPEYAEQAEGYFPVSAAYLARQSLYIRSTLLPRILSMSDHLNPPL